MFAQVVCNGRPARECFNFFVALALELFLPTLFYFLDELLPPVESDTRHPLEEKNTDGITGRKTRDSTSGMDSAFCFIHIAFFLYFI
jgi:hypothetical protein